MLSGLLKLSETKVFGLKDFVDFYKVGDLSNLNSDYLTNHNIFQPLFYHKDNLKVKVYTVCNCHLAAF